MTEYIIRETGFPGVIEQKIVGELVRCKDCEFWKKQKDSAQGRCELMQMYPTGAWYCGNAQKKDIS